MSVSPSALKTELNTDPLTLGYAAFIANGDQTSLANLLNATTGAGAASVFRNNVAEKDVVNAIASADFKNLTQLQISKLQFLFPAGALLDATVANTRQIIVDLFSTASAGTITAITAVGTKTGSRAEVLFGTGTVITTSDIRNALNS